MWVPSRPKEELSMKNSELYKYGNYFRYASFHECPTWKSGLVNGQAVAVKKLDESVQREKQFRAEVHNFTLISNIGDKLVRLNLVSNCSLLNLVGCIFKFS
jgi:hypothetical protein